MEALRPVHHPHESVDQIVDVAERTRLLAVAEERDRLAGERLPREVAHHAPVVGMHPRAVGVEDADDPHVDLVLPEVVEHQGLGAALAFVVARAGTDRVHVAAVALRLRMHLGVAVDLARRGVEDPRLHPLGEAEHVDRAHDRGLGRLDRVVLVVARRRGAGEVVDLIDLEHDRLGHVVADQLEVAPAEQVGDVRLLAREEVVEADDVVPLLDETIAKVRAEEAGTAGDEDPLDHFEHSVFDEGGRARRRNFQRPDLSAEARGLRGDFAATWGGAASTVLAPRPRRPTE